MGEQALTPEDFARAAREHLAGQTVLNVVAGMDREEGMTAVVLAMATLAAGIAQDSNGTADSAADLARRMVGVAAREARRQFGRVRRAPMGRC